MADQSSIEWTDSTFNPWIGCQKVGPGCDHCYAETLMDTRYGKVKWGPGEKRERTSAANWAKSLQWQRGAERFREKHGRRQRVFCASLADVFDNGVDPAWRRELLDLISRCPDLDWLVLTKRVGNVRAMLREAGFTALPRNVVLGATIVTQAEADRDIVKLVEAPAARRFLSMEPLLGPVNLRELPSIIRDVEKPLLRFDVLTGTHSIGPLVYYADPRMVDWVIVGGESGPGARLINPDWARSLRDQCAAANVPFLFKQWGEHLPEGQVDVDGRQWLARPDLSDAERGKIAWVEGFPHFRLGKRQAGRMLDEQFHNGFLEAA